MLPNANYIYLIQLASLRARRENRACTNGTRIGRMKNADSRAIGDGCIDALYLETMYEYEYLLVNYKKCQSGVSHVSFHVQRQMIRTRECPLAQSTMERSVTGVFPIMSSQFI